MLHRRPFFEGRGWLSFVVPLASALVLNGAEPVRDERVRLEVLAHLFPGSVVKQARGKVIDRSFVIPGKRNVPDFPDALKGELVYVVRGPAMNKSESCAAEDLSEQHPPSNDRELRFMLYRISVRPRRDVFVAVAQYQFIAASPAMSCSSIARFVLLRKDGTNWLSADEVDPDTTHHNGIQSLEFRDIDGDDNEEFIVESDSGGGGVHTANLTVFDISKMTLLPLISIVSRNYTNLENEERSALTLDVARTVGKKGREFCFTKKTYQSNGQWVSPPRVNHPCYSKAARLTEHLD
jgi:hypothetical protein